MTLVPTDALIVEMLNAPRSAQARIEAHFGVDEPDIRWPGGEALVAAGKLAQADLQTVAEKHRRDGAAYGVVAARMNILGKEDLRTAFAIDRGFLLPTAAAGGVPKDLVLLRKPKSKEAEQFRAIRTRLLTMRDAEKLNLFSLASLGGRRGARRFALNLAASFAQLGKTVALVDADPEGDRLRRCFGMPPEGPSLLDALAGQQSAAIALRDSPLPNLSIAPAGASTGRSADALASDRLQPFFEELAGTHDIVMAITPPFDARGDGGAAARFAWAATGRVLALVRQHFDRAGDLNALRQALRQVGAEPIGAVMAR